jgi:hypothetical protein
MDIKGALNAVAATLRKLKDEHAAMQAAIEVLMKQASPRSITAEIDAIPGRRLWYNLTGRIPFTIEDDGRRGLPINLLISQDGPFIQTHYPFALWLPSSPAGATNRGLWRPVTPYPLPTQAVSGAVPEDLNDDLISISYEVIDTGSQRNFQNEAAPPLLSRPDLAMPLPVPTLFTPNTTIQFVPTYERILFNNEVTPPDEGTLVVLFPGYRVVNL